MKFQPHQHITSHFFSDIDATNWHHYHTCRANNFSTWSNNFFSSPCHCYWRGTGEHSVSHHSTVSGGDHHSCCCGTEEESSSLEVNFWMISHSTGCMLWLILWHKVHILSLLFPSIHVGSTDTIESGRTFLKDDGSTKVGNPYSETKDHYSAIAK